MVLRRHQDPGLHSQQRGQQDGGNSWAVLGERSLQRAG